MKEINLSKQETLVQQFVFDDFLTVKMSAQDISCLDDAASSSSTGRPEEQFLVHFRSNYTDFRFPELKAVAQLAGAQNVLPEGEISRISRQDDPRASAFLHVRMCLNRAEESSVLSTSKRVTKENEIEKQTEEIGLFVAKRCVTVQGIYRVLARASDLDGLIANALALPASVWAPFLTREEKRDTFCMDLIGHGIKYSAEQKFAIFRRLEGIPLWKALTVDTKLPRFEFAIIDDFGTGRNAGSEGDRQFYLCHRIGRAGTQGANIERYNVKKRKYIGTTTMESELSLIMANMAWARPNTLMLDPFVGTGSCLVTCAHFGSLTWGWDIDVRPLRGTDGGNIRTNFSQYGFPHLLGDILVADSSATPLRTGLHAAPGIRAGLFDMIVCDPPYGAREGSKRVGKKARSEARAQRASTKPQKEYDTVHYPQKLMYSTGELMSDLIRFASTALVLGGRLVFWFPTTVETFSLAQLPRHRCMEVVATSTQRLAGRTDTGARCRVLVTMTKTQEPDVSEMHPSTPSNSSAAVGDARSGRAIFSQKVRK